MGTLGQYLHNARVEKEIDLREAALQTRINIQFLKALEDEDFSKLPGEVFVRGFLKSYGRFLNLSEAEVLKRYSEVNPGAAAAPSKAEHPQQGVETEPGDGKNEKKKLGIEPFFWGAAIILPVLFFLFTSLPSNHTARVQAPVPGSAVSAAPVVTTSETGSNPAVQSEKLYLELVALEDTWLLVRTDASPQKKAILKKGESLIWSGDEGFLLSYARVGSMKLVLNGQELTVNAPKESAVRELAVNRSGIVNQLTAVKQLTKPKPLKAPVARLVAEHKPSSEQHPSPSSLKPAEHSSLEPAASPARLQPVGGIDANSR